MPSMTEEAFFLTDESATDALGARLALAIGELKREIDAAGLNIYLIGNLGAGKTYLTRALLRELGVTGRIKSPPFSLIETYEVEGLPYKIAHFDFYRFESPEEFLDAGFRDEFGEGHLTLCEWPEKAQGCVPPSDLDIIFDILPKGRKVRILAHSTLAQTLLAGVQQ